MQKISRTAIGFILILSLVLTAPVFSDGATAATKKPAKVSGVKVKADGDRGIKITWKKAKRAKKYQIAYKEANTAKWFYIKTKKRSYSKFFLKERTVYQVKVRALNGKKKGKWTKTVSKASSASFERQVFSKMNQERAKRGLPAYVWNTYLTESANIRGRDLYTYFSHDRPNGDPVFKLSPLITGENIAMGQTSPAWAVSDWMASTMGHREAILSTSYKTAAVGHYKKGGYHYWVILFSWYDVDESREMIEGPIYSPSDIY